MQFPLSFWEISLWLAFNAIILLITSELIQTPHPHAQVVIDKKRLRLTALTFGLAFMVTVIMHAYQ